jgi:ribonuclease P protein component
LPPPPGPPPATPPAARRPFGAFAYPRARRLTRPAEFDAVRERGRRVRAEHLDVRVLVAEEGAAARVGIIVPRHKHSAVDRNRLKRRLRELVRTRLLPTLPPTVHLVVRARREAYADAFDGLARQVDGIGRDVGRMVNRAVDPERRENVR